MLLGCPDAIGAEGNSLTRVFGGLEVHDLEVLVTTLDCSEMITLLSLYVLK